MNEKREVESKVVLKSGIWYTVSNFAFRAIAFITTPIFTRVLSKAEYGAYNNINSWVSILVVLTACDLHSSIIRAKLDFEDDIEGYSFSTLTLSSIITLLFYLICLLNGTVLESLFGFDRKYFHVIFLYILFNEAYYTFITLERARYRYKSFSLLTGISIFFTSISSVVLVLLLNNKLDARVYGQYFTTIMIGILMYCLIAHRGKKIRLSYYKYAIMLSLPLVPHQLSLILLSSSDRIMITNMIDEESTALYSIAYSITNIIAILLDSMNKAWAPWLLDSLKINQTDKIKKTTTVYVLMFFVLIVGALIFAPEVVFIMGGKKYMESITVLPPLIVGCIFQFAYTMYVQLEFYEKKMKMVAIGTIIAAAVNIALNFAFIPVWGYAVAGYTTLIGYVVLFFLHYRTICQYGYQDIFDRRIIFGVLAICVLLIFVFEIVYSINLLRYALGICYLAGVTVLLWKYWEKIVKFIK